MPSTPQNEIAARLYAGLYLGTRRQKRFWGWSSRGWGRLSAAKAERPLTGLAAWLRLAHEHLDGDHAPLPHPAGPSNATAEAQDKAQPHLQAGKERRLQFVFNRRMIGLLFR